MGNKPPAPDARLQETIELFSCASCGAPCTASVARMTLVVTVRWLRACRCRRCATVDEKDVARMWKIFRRYDKEVSVSPVGLYHACH